MLPKVRINKILLLNIILIILGTLIVTRLPIDPDFGWHYMYGKQILDTKVLPTTNEFSYPTQGDTWVNSYWLSQIIIYLIYSKVSYLVAAVIFGILFNVFLVFLFISYEKTKKPSIYGFVVLALNVFMATFLITGRPLYFSTIFIILLIYILDTNKSKAYWLCPLIIIVWTNLHADFMLGLGIIGIYYLIELINSIKESKLDIKKASIPILVVLISCLATLINPRGINLWITLFKEMTVVNKQAVQEWYPVSITEETMNFVIFLTFWILTLGTILKNRKNMEIWKIATTLFFLLLSIKARYFFRPFIIIAIPLISPYLIDFLEIKYKKVYLRLGKPIKYLTIYAVVLNILFILQVFISKNVLLRNLKDWSRNEKYPYDAVQYIKKHESKFTGNMFNKYGWGGYLIWQLPEYKTFIDGRLGSWGEDRDISVKEDYERSANDIDKFLCVIDKYDISWILVEKEVAHGIVVEENRDKFEVLDETEIYILATPKD